MANWIVDKILVSDKYWELILEIRRLFGYSYSIKRDKF